MKKFKVKETYMVTGWTFVSAETKEAAEAKVEQDYTDNFQESDTEHAKTFWDTFQEVVPMGNGK